LHHAYLTPSSFHEPIFPQRIVAYLLLIPLGGICPASEPGALNPMGLNRSFKGTETILLVEDELGVRALTQYGLQLYGYTVLTARDGEEAILMSKRHEGRIHALVTDVAMPKLNGPKLARHLVALHPRIKVLFMSGDDNADASTFNGANQKRTELLKKPFALDLLARKLRELLDIKS